MATEHGQTVKGTVAGLERSGYTAQFRVTKSGTIHCSICNDTYAPTRFRLEGIGRAEGASDPADESIVAAMKCPCGARGTEAFGFGPSADAGEMEALRAMPDERRRNA